MLLTIRKVLKYLLLFFIGIVLLTVITLTWAVKNPQSLWSMTEQHLLPQDMHITWSDIRLEVKHLSSFNFYFDWEITDLHIIKSSPGIDIPIDHVRLEASVFPQSKEQKVIIHHVLMRAVKTVHFHPSENPKTSVEKNPFQMLQDYVHYIEIFQKYADLKNVDVAIKEFRLKSSVDQYQTISVALNQDEKSDQLRQLNFALNIVFPGQKIMLFEAHGQFVLPVKPDADLALKSQIVFSGQGVRLTEKIDMNHSNKKTHLKVTGPVSYKNKKLNLKSDLIATMIMDSKGADLDLTAQIKGISGKLVKVNTLKATLHSPFEKDQTLSSNFSTFAVTVPINIFFIDPDMARPLAESCQCKIPEVIGAKLAGKLWLGNLTTKNRKKLPVLDADLKLENVDNKLLSINAAGRLVIDKENNKYDIHPSIDTVATINSFQGLRQFLDAKGILIPAPLNVLEGQVGFTLRGPVDAHAGQFIFPAVTTLKLNSKRQAVDLQTRTRIALNEDLKAADIKVDILIDQLQLELPPLDPIQGKPRIVPDQRIIRSKVVKKESEFKLTVSVEARTTKPGSVKLISRFFDPYLPVTFNFHQMNGKKKSGFIQLEPFDVNYVRRTVHVEKMQIALPEGNSKFFEVDGRLRVKQTQYTVYIDIQGPSNAPNITFSSVPYLPRSEIISVLIYDRTSDELVSSDAKTASHVESAVVDRAVGLLGIWAFAATPIKGFSYNPVTKVYTATVAVSDDVTASVGTNWEEATQVELRRKVAKQWMLTAAWTPGGRDQEESTSLVLQWENRF